KLPVGDLGPAAEPIIGPRVNERAGTSSREGCANLPIEHARLGVLAVAQAVEADFRHEQGPVAGDVVKSGQVGVQAGLGLEIDVEANEIEKRELEIFGGRIIDVGHQAVGIAGFGQIIEPLEKTLQLAAAMPTHDRGWKFVAEGIT